MSDHYFTLKRCKIKDSNNGILEGTYTLNKTVYGTTERLGNVTLLGQKTFWFRNNTRHFIWAVWTAYMRTRGHALLKGVISNDLEARIIIITRRWHVTISCQPDGRPPQPVRPWKSGRVHLAEGSNVVVLELPYSTECGRESIKFASGVRKYGKFDDGR